MSLVARPAFLAARRRGLIPAAYTAVHPSEVTIHGRRSWVSASAGILGGGGAGRLLVVRGFAPRGDLHRLALHRRLPGVLRGDGAIGLRVVPAEHPVLVARGPDEDELLALLVPVVLGGGEQEGAQAALLIRAAADHGDLSRLEHEARREVAEGLLLLAVVDPELLGRIRRGVGQGLIGTLDRAVVDLGSEPQRDAVAALVRGGHAEVTAGGQEVLAVGAVLAVQEEA